MIKSGLAAGDKVLRNPGANLKDGQATEAAAPAAPALPAASAASAAATARS
jgi:hypothetical protein